MYTDFFKLAKKPFQLTPSATVLYQSPEVKQCYNKLLDGVRAGHELILVTGEQGTGKTLLAQRLQADLKEEPSSQCINLPFTALSLDETLEYICAELELNYGLGRNEDSLAILETFLTQGISPIKAVVIIIDEAQNLTADILNSLLSLIETGSNAERIVQIVLLARNEQEMQLERPELTSFNKKISLHCQIHPFAAEQVQSYIEYQLELAGASDTRLFSPETCARIFQYTGGHPRAINLLCDQVLAMAAHDGVKTITLKQIDAVHRHVEFQDTIETRTSPTSDAIADYINQIPAQPGTPPSGQKKDSASLREPDTLPEPEVPEELANLVKAQLNSNTANTASGYSQTARKKPWLDTQTQPRGMPDVLTEESDASSANSPIRLSWAILIASVLILSLFGLLYSQLQFQKETIDNLEEKLTNLESEPATANNVIYENNSPEPTQTSNTVNQQPPPTAPVVSEKTATSTEKAPPQPLEKPLPIEKIETSSTTQKTIVDPTFTNSDQTSLSSSTIFEHSHDDLENDVTTDEIQQLSITNPHEEEQTRHVDQTKIAELHSKIAEQIANDKLTEPKGDNAIETYQHILELDPRNQQAKDGIFELKEDFIRWAKNSEKKKEWRRASYQYAKALEIDPYDEELKDIVKKLNKKLFPSDRRETLTIVLEYARTGNTREMAELLEKGAFVNVRDKSGNTALMLATDHGHISAVETLLSFDADVNLANKIGDTSLMNAVWNNHLAIAELLLRENADVKATNRHGWTALTYASIHGHTSLFKTLRKAGASLEHRTHDGKSPLAAAAHNGQKEVVSLLLEQGAEIDSRDNEDWTPLMHAVWNNHARVVKHLLLNKSEVNNQNKEGWTPLMLAAWNGFDDIVIMLLDSGADKSIINNKGNLAQELARRQKHQKIIGLLQ